VKWHSPKGIFVNQEAKGNSMNEAPQGLVSASEIMAYLSQDRYLSLSETVKYISLSESTIKKRLSEIPHFRVGKKPLFRKSELDRWLLQYRERGDEMDLDRLADDALKGIL
jgi:excisionase family DNA binding protein